MPPDYWRQLKIFDPTAFNIPVHIIGAGNIGSEITRVLVKMGIKNITVWDDSIVEKDKPLRGVYGAEEIGTPKTAALKKILARDLSIEIKTRNEKINGSQALSGIIFVCTGSLSGQKDVWEKALKFNPSVKLVIETRITSEEKAIYCVKPLLLEEIKEYEKTFIPGETTESSLPESDSLAPIIAGIAGHIVIKVFAGEEFEQVIKLQREDKHQSYEMFCVKPIITTACSWDQKKEHMEAGFSTFANFNVPVHIIGAGATGSEIARNLVKAGAKDITAWDFDSVEIHNPPNSIYGMEEIGMLKVEALKKILLRNYNVEIKTKNEAVDGSQRLEGIVFICTDTMSSRKQIWDKALKAQADVRLVVETRLGAELGIVYTVRPSETEDIAKYENTLYNDSEAEESPCNYRAISTVVSVIAGIASDKPAKFSFKEKNEAEQNLEGGGEKNKEAIRVQPINIITNFWNSAEQTVN